MTSPAFHSASLLKTALYDMHLLHGAKMVPFAGYELPIHYAEGIVAEHSHTRSSVSLFDVSHMGTVHVKGAGVTKVLGQMIPADLENMPLSKMNYNVLLNEEGGIIDDLMITKNGEDDFTLVINGACKEKDIAFMRTYLPLGTLTLLENVSLLALQGPKASEVLSDLIAEVSSLTFLDTLKVLYEGHELSISRAGYTGEDGFEILISNEFAVIFAEKLLEHVQVKFAGLGARDSLRLEAGLCLYGQDLDESTTPIEAGIRWVIPQKRRQNADFNGAERILKQLTSGPERKRIGLLPDNKVMVRAGAELYLENGEKVGSVTSGSFTPVTDQPLAMGYVDADIDDSTLLFAKVRGALRSCRQAKMPFRKPNYIK